VKVVVVGSGLSAVGALKAIIKAGIKPVVIDVGRQLDPERQKIKLRMSMIQPMNWSDDDVKSLASNFTSVLSSAKADMPLTGLQMCPFCFVVPKSRQS